MNLGDMVRVVSVPAQVTDGSDEEIRKLFVICVGHAFPIAGFEHGRIELLVGEMLSKPDYMHSIWIEPDCVQPVRPATDPWNAIRSD